MTNSRSEIREEIDPLKESMKEGFTSLAQSQKEMAGQIGKLAENVNGALTRLEVNDEKLLHIHNEIANLHQADNEQNERLDKGVDEINKLRGDIYHHIGEVKIESGKNTTNVNRLWITITMIMSLLITLAGFVYTEINGTTRLEHTLSELVEILKRQ